MSPILLSLLLVSLRCRTALSQTVTLSVHASAPSNISPPIDPSFPGFAFEQASFYNYSFDANGKPNKFSQNLINSVLNRTGGTPILRVGGTSGDEASYFPDQPYALNSPATVSGPQIGQPYLKVGAPYYKAFSNFDNAQFIFMAPLFHENLTNTVEWVQQGLEHIGNRLYALEIGNEPNLYPWYNLQKYIKEYNSFLSTLADNFPQLHNQVIFQALDTSWGSKSDLTVPNAIAAGLNQTKQVKQVAHHYYQGNDKQDGLAGLQTRIANHTAIAAGVSSYRHAIEYLQQNFPEVDFVLSECGNTLGYHDPTQRNNLATALWNVDFQLFSMSIGLARVNMQQILQPGYGMWEPVASEYSEPLVRANFYSQPLVAEFIGQHPSTAVVEIPIPGTDILSAYAAYTAGTLTRIAIVNLNLWNGAGSRPVQNFVIHGLPKTVSSAVAKHLTAPQGAYANTTLTWAGSQWTYESLGTQVNVANDNLNLQVQGGSVSVSVQATSAIIIEFS